MAAPEPNRKVTIRPDVEAELRARLNSIFTPPPGTRLSVRDRNKIVTFGLISNVIQLQDDRELNACLNILSDSDLLLATVKAILLSASFNGPMGGHLSESMSLKILKASRAISVMAKLGVPHTEFLGVHCATFNEVACRRKSMSVDTYLRWFLPTFVERLLKTSEHFMVEVVLFPIAMMLFHKPTSGSPCSTRDNMLAAVVKGNIPQIRPTRNEPATADKNV